MPSDLNRKSVLLIISGGIAAYKVLEVIRRLRDRGIHIRAILTKGGAEFVTPLSVAALTENKVYQDLFSLTDEAEMGHIRLSREADLVLVAPASADILAKMATGQAGDLATTALLATNKPVMIAPAMNVEMWNHPATQANIATLESRGVLRVGPSSGDLACGEFGSGRLAEPAEIIASVVDFLEQQDAPKPLAGKKAVVTSGPTHEPIDPVRYIANRSSGKQGHAIAEALAAAGAEVTLVTGPVTLPDPAGVKVVRIETAREMLAAVQAALPADIAVCAAAVADWRTADEAGQKLKKDGSGVIPDLKLSENPDILATISKAGPMRPGLVIGFAAETENVTDHARAKRARKGCDWILANDVAPATGTFGGDDNEICLISGDDETSDERWERQSKTGVARALSARIIKHFS
ncbi:MAG: bifunctional phosphopantothenoylcysteine decarboxylase/phosphopantothenate--cysteine ligase CoaBC [Thalassospira sp.]|uniref:bifunctional phosphopantothenoylcysteine decarboxylase/phosphopantothenate--cysteine ligase CoaBC n=1 Tax=Thalassospira sp. TaxID=1912094 RepID=UPI001B0F13EB|nr:bifunctional phosphopantothenoylcysteine decarboxylase/phosphopantothenate--cysteine ligase CoaBC [Thalassospira sp.]MBO6578215.1 bifunctional phosphopantothenoylcysteine decarboxylase/phosphopantothenate--cysteine ligase CoaBC [Thalassospira sp.]MBO6802229.1 bifunctional phosphopantothenoylcysteine decarboxylase/phosphopantothenate--cysteine ligase CoaBC [Thalassospira sp.]MBO6817933.1 bifunctional phosphopantothenoylcysteine decarboxylase/phosphopantothenate--cysteine ligase CoaBC [Thalasso